LTAHEIGDFATFPSAAVGGHIGRREYVFDPPLFVAPGATLEIQYSPNSLSQPPGDLNISGWQIYDTDL